MHGGSFGALAERLGRSGRRIAEIEETESSDDGLVTATVGGSGELRALWLDPRIYRTEDADALAAAVLDAVRAANESARRRVFAAYEELLPPGATFEEADLVFDPVLTELDRLAPARPGNAVTTRQQGAGNG